VTSGDDPLLARVRAGLSWPTWSDWTAVAARPSVQPAAPPAQAAPPTVPRLIADGGPYLEIYGQRPEAAQGPLTGWTFAIKDLVAVAGHRTSAGSAVRADAAPETRTAPIVTQLEAAGATAVGSVALHEFAFGVTGVNHHAGTAPNPQAPDRVPGGSSSGSASAVADGSARIAIGTDTGGSVRIPAAFCGVVGYKPSHGLYPAEGVFPLSATLDHVGLFANSMIDIATAHAALGYQAGTAGLPNRVGVAPSDLAAADPDVRSAIEAALDRLRDAGAEVVDIDWPDPELTFVVSTAIMFSEAAAIHAPLVAAHRDRYGADILARLGIGAALTGPEVASAHELRRQLIAQVTATLAGVDTIVSPTTQIVAPLLTEAENPALPPRVVANTRLANVIGLPAISLPVATDGPPVGLQVLGLDDASLIGHALGIEAVLG